MKCECGEEMKSCKNGVVIGSLKKGIKMRLLECPKCKRLKSVKETIKF